MKYEIKVPPGAALPLAAVAEAMARTEATRGGTKFHKPTYKGSLSSLIAAIAMEAKDGRLPVTDQYGFLSTVEKLLASEDATTAYTRFDDEVREVNHDITIVLNCFTTLHLLNEWAATRGDEFALTDGWVDWIDERGEVLPPTGGASISGVHDLIAAKIAYGVLNGLKESSNKAAGGAKDKLEELERLAAKDTEGMLGVLERFAAWLAHRADSYDATNDPASGDYLRGVRGKVLRGLEDGIQSSTSATYYAEGSEDTGAATAPANKPPASDSASNTSDWIGKARTIADRIARNRYNAGVRQISARSISQAVTDELEKDPTTHGLQGPRGESNVRNDGLRGWKFIPPQVD